MPQTEWPGLLCSVCGHAYRDHDEFRWRCDCGGPLDLEGSCFQRPSVQTVDVPAGSVSWQVDNGLPNGVAPVSLGEPITPLIEWQAYDRRVSLKLEQLHPTGSFKDRGAAVMIGAARGLGASAVHEDSSGNAGAAVAAYAARAGIACEIFVPATISPAKLAQIAAYGATIRAIPGDRAAAAQAAWERAGSSYYASHVWNPYFLHGVKSVAYEIVDQLGRPPNAIVVPAGNGTLLLGLDLGFREMLAAGRISRRPALHAVQSAAYAPLVHRLGATPADLSCTTIADGIAIASPARLDAMARAVTGSGGSAMAVDDREIEEAKHLLARSGWYVEPTAAVAVAALRHLDIPLKDDLVIPLTGHGLKSGSR